MSRLDQKNGGDFKGPKTVVSMGPSAEEVQETMASKRSGVEPPIQTAASYNDRVKAQKAQTEKLKGGNQPLGGAPPLDSEKMKQLADGLSLPRPDFGGEEPEPVTEEAAAPEPAEERPPPVRGVGSAYQINQEMAQGKIKSPVSIPLRGAKKIMAESKGLGDRRKPLSQKSIEDLEKMKKVQEAQEEREVESPLKDVMEEDNTSEELDKVTDEMLHRDGNLFDYGAIQEQQRILLDKNRRAIIEKQLEPLAIEDMILKREIRQDVPVIPKKLMYTLRTFSQREYLFCLQYVYEHPGSVLYNEEFLNTCKLICSLVAINGSHLPDHRDNVDTAKEEVTKELFEQKMFHVASLPTPLMADISIQVIWFNDRVAELFSLDNLKNG